MNPWARHYADALTADLEDGETLLGANRVVVVSASKVAVPDRSAVPGPRSAHVPRIGFRRPPILTAREAQALLDEGVIAGGMTPRVTAAVRAVREGVRSVHIIDGGVPSALLLEVLTAAGVGTAVRSDSGPHFFADSRAYLMASEARGS